MSSPSPSDQAQAEARTALLRAIARQAAEMADDPGSRDAASLANLAHAYAAVVSAVDAETVVAAAPLGPSGLA
ncbi:hypothetical protein [Actinomadura parmotrematis]|uniref:Uncharacterized protein n=1 Tax=Actinomadura parmotrematis TaxID=2864039 RepID=A0ABS7FS82_9ACTN|nr:hypothetical protein [Actinomadura parmotrematis]MBW8482378.1 hypothetical protein [Actinomadura parmotrematis]